MCSGIYGGSPMNAPTHPGLEDKRVDPIELQIVKQRLIAVPNLIEKNVERTSFSLLVQEYKDYAVGFVDAEGRLVSQSRHSLPAFVANALGLAVRAGLRELGPNEMHEGDVLIVSEAAVLGKHINDVVAYTPVRCNGALIGFFAVLVHWIDVGGAVVGSCFSPSTTDVFQEGMQFPTVKLVRRGERVRDIFRIIQTNTRFPKLLMGDLEAQLGGCRMGHDMIQEIVSQYGAQGVLAAIDEMFLDADRAMERALRAVPPGTYRASSFMDDDGVRRGEPIRIDVSVTVADGRMTVDLSGLSDQLAGPFNAGRDGGAVAVARMAAKFLFAGATPVNEGDFQRIDVVIPDGKFLSAWPDAPVGGAGNTSATVVDTIVSALAPALAGRVPAGHHGIYGTHTITGTHATTGERFLSLDAMSGGWGAFADRDGPGPYRSMTHGDVRDVPVEVQEANYPYRIEAKRLRVDSGGPGKHRGGLGVEKVYRFLQKATLLAKIERTGCPPWGVNDGLPGASPAGELLPVGGEPRSLGKGQWAVAEGDVARILSGGGGGYGDPFERDPRAVAEDVRMGYVSVESGALDYGVVVTPEGEIDTARTRALRGARTSPTAIPRNVATEIYAVFTRPHPGSEREFNYWYSTRHVHDLVAIPGITFAQRFKLAPDPDRAGEGDTYLAIYGFSDTRKATDGIAARRGTDRMPSTSALDRSASMAVIYTPAGSAGSASSEDPGSGSMLLFALSADVDQAERLSGSLSRFSSIAGVHSVQWYRASSFQTKPQPPAFPHLVLVHLRNETEALASIAQEGGLRAMLSGCESDPSVDRAWLSRALTARVTP